MYCMKCGRDIKPGQVFCESCLQVMEQHPVKPDTVVHLPRRSGTNSTKKPRKRVLSAEEQIALLKKRSHRLAFWLTLSLLLLGLSLGALAYLLFPGEEAPDASIPAVTSTYRYLP